MVNIKRNICINLIGKKVNFTDFVVAISCKITILPVLDKI